MKQVSPTCRWKALGLSWVHFRTLPLIGKYAGLAIETVFFWNWYTSMGELWLKYVLHLYQWTQSTELCNKRTSLTQNSLNYTFRLFQWNAQGHFKMIFFECTVVYLKVQSAILMKCLSSTANQIIPLPPCFWISMLIGYDTAWLAVSHFVCFTFTEPGLCTDTRE